MKLMSVILNVNEVHNYSVKIIIIIIIIIINNYYECERQPTYLHNYYYNQSYFV